MSNIRHFLLAASLVISGSGVAQAQADYPNRPIRMIVPVAAGGLTDILSRMLGQRLGERLGQPVVVENKTGAGGNIAMEAAAKSAPDGYTIVMTYMGVMSVNSALFKSLPYDPVADFVPISLVASFPLVLAVNPSVTATNVKELVAHVKKNPGKVSYASGGNGTTGHLAMELFKKETGVHIVHIPYRGAAPAMNDLISGQVALTFDSITLVMPQANAGKVRALAIAGSKRSPLAPNLPTVAESGVPGFDVSGWYGIAAPAGTPKPIVDRLTKELIAIVNEPTMRQQLAARGIEPIGQDGAEFASVIRRDTVKWKEVVQRAQIRID